MRILVIKQVELWTLITKLQDLDRKDAADDNKFLDLYVRIRDLDGVKDRHHKSVYDFNVNNRSFECGEEAFLFQRDDFVSTKTSGSAKSNQIEDMIESYLQNKPDSKLHTLFVGNDEKIKSSAESHVVLLSTFRLGLALKIVT
ncbi:hypothetical protein IFR05_017240, partial [Cadophora sp. M221]